MGQVLGGFFIINREGKLELRKYGSEPVLDIAQKHRFSSSLSDFITRYTAVSSTNMRTETAEYYSVDPDDGLTMNLGVNPLLQFGLDETRAQLCTNILNDLQAVNYVPFDSDTIGNPALDLGDVLTFSGGQADGDQITCITSIKYAGYRNKCVVRDGYVYIPSYDAAGVYKVNLENSAAVTLISLGFTSAGYSLSGGSYGLFLDRIEDLIIGYAK